MVLGLDKVEVLGKQQVILQLARGSHGDGAEAREFGIAVSSAPFGEIGGDRRTASPQLTDQPESLFPRKSCRDLVNRQCHLVRLLPNLQFMEILHWHPWLLKLIADR